MSVFCSVLSFILIFLFHHAAAAVNDEEKDHGR